MSFIPIGSRLSTETEDGVTPCESNNCFIPIGSRLSTETRSGGNIGRDSQSFIPIGSRLSTETVKRRRTKETAEASSPSARG